MDKKQVQFIMDVVKEGRILFPYFRDYYAVYLLQRQVSKGCDTLRDLRQSAYGRLLDRPTIKAQLGQWGDGKVTAGRLAMLYPEEPLFFRISFTTWGSDDRRERRWNQTSRRGHNLVLQLNFNGRHNKAYRRLVKDRQYHPFHFSCHPAEIDQEITLAWARLDIAEDYRYALIEEIQTDWYRSALEDLVTRHRRYRDAQGRMHEEKKEVTRSGLKAEKLKAYLNGILRPFGEVWEEAILTATLQFLFEEIGVDQVFYHTYELGCQLKDCRPPRSLYSKLPRRFCFRETNDYPAFLASRLGRKLKAEGMRFFVMRN